MTLANITLTQALQWAGVAAVAAGILATLLFGGPYVPIWLPIGLAALAIDAYAIRTASDLRAMLAAMLKFAVVIAGLSFVPGAAPAASIIPADSGPVLLMLSVLPTAAGAMNRGRE